MSRIEALLGTRLLWYRLCRTGVYTWENALLGVVLAISITLAILNIGEYLSLTARLQLPLAGFNHSLGAESRSFTMESAATNSIPQKDVTYQYLLAMMVIPLFLLGLLGALARPIFQKNRWDDPLSEELRVLPVRPFAILFSHRDAWLAKYAAVYTFMVLLWALPSRRLAPIEAEWHMEEIFLACFTPIMAFVSWTLIFSVYRSVQLMVVRGMAPRQNPMVRGWVIAFFVLLLWPTAMTMIYGIDSTRNQPFCYNVALVIPVLSLLILLNYAAASTMYLIRPKDD